MYETDLISIATAQQLVLQHAQPAAPIQRSLQEALGHFLAYPVMAPLDLPPFHQSAMDGYAFYWQQDKNEYRIAGEVKAGDAANVKVRSGEAVRIFTGAPLPAGTDTVIMQEKVQVGEDRLILLDEKLQRGGNVRSKGEQVTTGDLALEAGTQLTPAAIGFMADLGLEKVAVRQTPLVSIVVTGNELRSPGEVLEHGQIYESNSYALSAALQTMGIHRERINTYRTKDQQDQTRTTIEEALQYAHVLLISGGISVGDYDLVGQTLQDIGVEKVFYKVKQKPGKPLFFGIYGEKLVFALPGNPASALVCFYEYVYPAIRKRLGSPTPYLTKIALPLANTLTKKGERPCFFRAKVSQGKVHFMEAQASFIMQTFAKANAFIYVPGEVDRIEAGEMVEVHLLP